MKKLAILATMFAAVTLASCGGAKEGEGENTDSTAVEAEATTETTEEVVEEPAADTAAADTAAVK